MLVYRLPTPNEYGLGSLGDVSLSRRSLNDNEKFRECYLKLKKAGKSCQWPPKDDPLCDVRMGWALPDMRYIQYHPECYYAHRLGVHLMCSPLMNDCVSYVYHAYVKKYGDKRFEKTDTNSWGERYMKPQEEHITELKQAATTIFQAVMKDQPLVYGHPIVNLRLVRRYVNNEGATEREEITEMYTPEEILRVFNRNLPLIARWCLAAYTHSPEDWTVGTGKYTVQTVFKTVVHELPKLEFDALSPEILADVERLTTMTKKQVKAYELGEDIGGIEADKEHKKQRHDLHEKKVKHRSDNAWWKKQKKQQEEESWLDKSDHSFYGRHDE